MIATATPATTASFTGGVLTVIGDNQDNTTVLTLGGRTITLPQAQISQL
ncbi:MAG TPA: hypothetical protein VIU11_12600 [Nakamurella sp.]